MTALSPAWQLALATLWQRPGIVACGCAMAQMAWHMALNILHAMPGQAVRPNIATYNVAIKALPITICYRLLVYHQYMVYMAIWPCRTASAQGLQRGGCLASRLMPARLDLVGPFAAQRPDVRMAALEILAGLS